MRNDNENFKFGVAAMSNRYKNLLLWLNVVLFSISLGVQAQEAGPPDWAAKKGAFGQADGYGAGTLSSDIYWETVPGGPLSEIPTPSELTLFSAFQTGWQANVFAQSDPSLPFDNGIATYQITGSNSGDVPIIVRLVTGFELRIIGDADSAGDIAVQCYIVNSCNGSVLNTYNWNLALGPFQRIDFAGVFSGALAGMVTRDGGGFLADAPFQDDPTFRAVIEFVVGPGGEFFVEALVRSAAFASSAETAASLEFTVVPIPPALWLLSSSLAGLLLLRRHTV